MGTFNKQVLRITTAGSVDDGKSTLIGRLLYDTKSIPADKLTNIEEASRRKGLDYIDLSLLTDGLVAEREQGITIDVAHIYFATQNRKYIIADSPGHVEYTRNMVTGASNADVSIILVDARKGLLEQTKRHLYISYLLRVPKVMICINKMDLVNYSQIRFDEIVGDFKTLIADAGLSGIDVSFLPISSLYGENIVTKTDSLDWYSGGTLIDILEQLEVKAEQSTLPARFPIQYVIRPKTEAFHDYRGYAGKIASGTLSIGDTVTLLPSGIETKIASIHKFESDMETAIAGDSVSITLTDDIGASRGDMLVKGKMPNFSKELKGDICWMDNNPLNMGNTYILQHGIGEYKAKVESINYKVDTSNLSTFNAPANFELNDIGEIVFKLSRPILAESYHENRSNGAFILIDDFSKNTVAVGFVKAV